MKIWIQEVNDKQRTGIGKERKKIKRDRDSYICSDGEKTHKHVNLTETDLF